MSSTKAPETPGRIMAQAAAAPLAKRKRALCGASTGTAKDQRKAGEPAREDPGRVLEAPIRHLAKEYAERHEDEAEKDAVHGLGVGGDQLGQPDSPA